MYFNFFKARERRVSSPFFFFIVLIIFGFLFLIPNVIAVPPFETTSPAGMQFGYSPYEVVKENTDFTLHLHVINATAVQTNLTTSCLLHLYNSQGDHILKAMLGYETPEFEYVIAGGNFTLGSHAYIIQCNNTNKEIHMVNGLFEVTETGTGEVEYFWVLIIAMLIAYGLIIFGESRNEFPPIIIGAMLLLILALYIWVNGIGSFEESNLISQLIAGATFVVGASLIIQTLKEMN